jgi:hypothetical protein
MVADLQEMQENQRVSEIRIDKSEFVRPPCCFLTYSMEVEYSVHPTPLHPADRR